MKKSVSLFLSIVVMLSLASCGGSSERPPNTEPPAPSPTEETSQTAVPSEDVPSESEVPATVESGRYTLPSGMELNFSDTVRKDVTGNWRISTTSSSTPVSDCALEYYETLFSSDDEIHAVWNATLGTTTSISASGGLLFVDTHEYVDGEEHDADLLFSGDLLDSQIISIETGEPL